MELPYLIWVLIEPEPQSGCWIWMGSRNKGGYGKIYYKHHYWMAHRLVYTLVTENHPGDLDLDHLCRVRACVNPKHLEPVTRSENLKRGLQGSVQQCPYGHNYDEKNTYHHNGHRYCRACHRKAESRRRSESRIGVP